MLSSSLLYSSYMACGRVIWILLVGVWTLRFELLRLFVPIFHRDFVMKPKGEDDGTGGKASSLLASKLNSEREEAFERDGVSEYEYVRCPPELV